jgi:hypothetical protein
MSQLFKLFFVDDVDAWVSADEIGRPSETGLQESLP